VIDDSKQTPRRPGLSSGSPDRSTFSAI